MSQNTPTAVMARLHYGGVPVPWTVSWSLEDRYFLDVCPHAGGLNDAAARWSPGLFAEGVA